MAEGTDAPVKSTKGERISGTTVTRQMSTHAMLAYQGALDRAAKAFLIAHNEARGPVPLWARVVKLTEEAGEAAGAFMRWTGHSRRRGDAKDVLAELSDVVMCAFLVAQEMGYDLAPAIAEKYDEVMTRGFGGE